MHDRVPHCTVVIPAYRASGCLARAVRSVLCQTVTDWELIVVADDHVDYSAVLRHDDVADSRITFLTTGHDGAGAGSARNVGADAAAARVVVTLDSDDTFDDRTLERIVPLALEHGAAYSAVRFVSDATGLPLTNLDRPVEAGPVGLEQILTSQIHTYAFVAFDRTRVKARWIEGRIGWEDVLFYASCFDDVEAMHHIDEPLYTYRRRDGSTTTESGAAEYFLQSATTLRRGLHRGDHLGIRRPETREIMVRYLQSREHLEAAYLSEEASGRCAGWLEFVAARRDEFYRLDQRSPSVP